MTTRAGAASFVEDLIESYISLTFTTSIEKLATMDAFIQFSQNPTSMSAGYAVKENYPYIIQNLILRYKLSRVTAENIIEFLKQHIERMKEIDRDIYFWRQALSEYIKQKKSNAFLKWYGSLYDQLDQKEKIKFLFLLNVAKRTTNINNMHKWFMPFFDKEEETTQDDLKNVLVEFGIGNILYYKSTSGYGESQFIPSLFLDQLDEKYQNEVPVNSEQIEQYFKELSLSNIKLLEKCVKENVPVLESRIGKVTQTSPLIVETSKSFFAASPFAYKKLKELIKNKKFELTRKWTDKLNNILNYFVKEVYPYAELKTIFENEGAYCWELRYTATPEKEPINIAILISPYIFPISTHSTIYDEMKRLLYSKLNLIILIKETLPTLAETFKYVAQRALIYLLDEKEEKFYLIEKRPSISPEEEVLIDAFLSKFLPIIEHKFPISKTWPKELEQYLENIKYYNKFPRLVTIRNRIPEIERKLRQTVRNALETKFGPNWKEQIKEKRPNDVKRWKNKIKERLDKEFAKDFLDGATLGELLGITKQFTDLIKGDKVIEGHLTIINRYRKTLEHPLKEQQSDIDEKTFNKLQIALDYIEKVLCA